MLSTDAIKVTKRIALLISVDSITTAVRYFFTCYDIKEILKNHLSYDNLLVYKNPIYLKYTYSLV